MEYTIVARSMVPLQAKRGPGKWKRLLDPLPFDQAICLEYALEAEARGVGNSVQSSMNRPGGRSYKVHQRVVANGDTFLLYLWKEPR